ncbi:hypothetical protein BHU72_11900 [Desulfuribacillus stibiiarsenatis]|uniref:Uncharacterized protein n=1 Tax=Desulfuribacillus stibiiarsenatis TaxID=1390249 RepID=A0A1E5L7U4_9FIRM|nr:hypothetical protein [Desulfuribacillus stibiiarsenatis]OEH86232.1 hypothetical protein BHU72_11900 [Desulfuribacillus stibiiarsenatis]
MNSAVTEDTKRQLKPGDMGYYIEGSGEWFETESGMIESCLESGMTLEEIEAARDLENGYIYWTEYDGT